MESLGFNLNESLSEKLNCFESIQQSIQSNSQEIAKLTSIEAETYIKNCYSTYLANNALVTVFTDVTERSPTFSLNPLS